MAFILSLGGKAICSHKYTNSWTTGRPGTRQPLQCRRRAVVLASKQDAQDDPKEIDWDLEWRRLQEDRKGGDSPGMKLPSSSDERRTDAQKRMDDRTERLTDAWANDRAFLFAIAGVFLLGLFYVRVYQTGGIAH